MRQSKSLNIKGDQGVNAALPIIDVNENLITRFKKEFNIIKWKSGTLIAYDTNAVKRQHAVNACKVFTLRRLLPNIIKYVGHHEQVMLWSDGDDRHLPTTHQAASFSGRIKAQSGKKIYSRSNNLC